MILYFSSESELASYHLNMLVYNLILKTPGTKNVERLRDQIEKWEKYNIMKM